MTTDNRNGWQVLDSRVWFYTYAFAKNGTANCLAVRAKSGKVIVLSPATGLSEAAFAELTQLGEVSALVATNGHHHLGMRAFRERFPQAKGYAPDLAATRIHKKNPGAGQLRRLSELQAELADDDLVIREAPLTRSGELWAFVKAEQGYIWFASDILINMEVLPDAWLPRMIFKLSRSAPGYRVFHAALALIVKDKKAVLGALLADVLPYPPAIVVPAHGAPVSGPGVAQQTLSMLQAALG